MRQFVYRASAGEDGLSLGAFLRRRGYPKGMLAAFRWCSCVWVNGAPCRIVDPVFTGDVIRILLPEESSGLIPNESLALPVLYEDEDILAINKPIDMLIHPAGAGFNDSVGNFFVAHCPGRHFRPIGRLDRNTTGVCLIAKHQLSAAILSSGDEIVKMYYAVAEGRIQPKKGTITASLAPEPGSRIKQQISSSGKPCATKYEVLWQNENISFLQLHLLTGRTHQIRVHMQYIGHPLAGDVLYDGRTVYISRPALHCGKLSFVHPMTGSALSVSSSLPLDMQEVLYRQGCFLPGVSHEKRDNFIANSNKKSYD